MEAEEEAGDGELSRAEMHLCHGLMGGHFLR